MNDDVRPEYGHRLASGAVVGVDSKIPLVIGQPEEGRRCAQITLPVKEKLADRIPERFCLSNAFCRFLLFLKV